MIKIIIADDHEIMREGLRTLIEKQKDMEVLAEAGDGRTAVRLANELSPDIVVMDTVMPDLNGVEATRQIVSANPRIKVIALSMYSTKQFVVGMLRAGASGYMLKDGAFRELIAAVRSVLSGEIYLSPRIGTDIIKDYVSAVPEKDSSVFSVLSNREREVPR